MSWGRLWVKMSESLGLTPSQTVGPFLHIVLPWEDGPDVVGPDTPDAVELVGQVRDGDGKPVTDALVETWQVDPTAPDARGFGRCPTDDDGRYRIRTRLPPALPAGDGSVEAPHLDVSVFARGLLDRLVTRVYFGDSESRADDPVLATVPPERRASLSAQPLDDGRYRFDIVLQGPDETVFFDL
jgi:protocatechuate 3,4-dioxygenase alpha subunit